jgi:hypothetical protein
VTAPAVSIAFFDLARNLHGTARSGTTVLFEGRSPTAIPEGPEIEKRRRGKLKAHLADRFSLELEPISEEVNLGGVVARTCKVTGEVGNARVDCLGTVSETREPPSWDELDAIRSLSALLDEEHAVLALARRPRGARGHGEERVVAYLIEAGEPVSVDDARISTVYDGEGRQRSAGLELWLPGEDFPRRGSGSAIAGSSLELEGLTVHTAVFRWRVEGREGVGAYELMVREESPAAA